MFGIIALSLLIGLGGQDSSGPKTGCMSCHCMRTKLDALRASSHGKVTTCRDCHERHGGDSRRLFSEVSDGFRHVLLTAAGAEPSVIRIHGPGAEVVQANCIRCHGLDTDRSSPSSVPRPKPQPKTSAHADVHRSCAECHRETSHAHLAIAP